jgi:hypothetical protein
MWKWQSHRACINQKAVPPGMAFWFLAIDHHALLQANSKPFFSVTLSVSEGSR